ncbi:hypothetical protein STEG23_037509 [Scotinomys teguina]
MEAALVPGPSPRRLLLLLGVIAAAAGVRAGDGDDFDLADALDPEPTTETHGGLYPKLPRDPERPDPPPHDPRPRPPPPQPRPQPPRPRPLPPDDFHSFGGNGGVGGPGGHDDSQGSTVARVVSPVVTVVVLALLGAGATYFRSGLGRRCRRGTSDPAPV